MKINLGKVFDTGGGGGGREPIVEALSVTENGTYTPNEGVDGFNEVNVNVPLTPQDVIVWRDGMGFNGGRYINENNAADFLFKADFSNVTKPYGLFRNIYFVSAESFNDILRKIPFEIKGDVSYMFNNAFIVSNDRDLHFDLFDLSKIEDASDMFANFNSNININVDSSMNLYFDGMRMYGSGIFKGCSANEIHITNPIAISLSNTFKNALIASKLYMPNVESTQITSLGNLFSYANIGEMDISNWKLPNLVYISYFADHANLSELTFEGWETGIITAAEDAFCYSKLKKLDLTNLKLNLDDSAIRKLFQQCSLLTDLNLSNYDMTAFSPRVNTAIFYPFYGCNALTNIVTNENTKLPDINWSASNFNNCPNLTAESMVNLFNALPVSTKGYTFTVGSTNLAKLSDEQKSVAINKGWTLS